VEREDGRAEGLADPPERLDARPGSPEPATQRQDRRVDAGHCLIGDRELVGDGGHGCSIADPDRHAVADRASKHLPREPCDPAPRDVRRAVEARSEVHRTQPEPLPERVAGRRRHLRPINDPDLDDALGPGLLEQPRDLRTGHAHERRDRLLGLAELVVQAADADERREVAHAVTQRLMHECAEQMCGSRCE
jgi:hypothetical protein